MGENDLDVRNECNYLSYKQDCDGDYDTAHLQKVVHIRELLKIVMEIM